MKPINANKLFTISGIVGFILIQVSGNYSVVGGLIAGLWLGFWLGFWMKKDLVKKIIIEE